MVPDLWRADEEIKNILFGKFEDLEKVKNFLEREEKNGECEFLKRNGR